jgi:formate dehydrogenase major subunit
VIRIAIDNVPREVREGQSLLHAMRDIGIRLPAICDDDRLAPSGACRLCLVRIKGWPHAVAACTTRVAENMEVDTDTPELNAVRRSLLEMLARHYPAAALAQAPDLPFHRALREAHLEKSVGTAPHSWRAADRSHPYLAVDMSRCIDCYRCVRICDEVQGQSVWHIRDRGAATRIECDGPTLARSSCVSCGACADTCPTGAIADRRRPALAGPAEWTRTVCPYCGVGCEIAVGVRGGRIVSVKPVLDAAVNKGHLCVKGRYAFEFVSAADRVTEPMIREGSSWRRVSWATARAFVAERLRAIAVRDGPGSIGFLGSARATNEDNYVVQKFARAVIGTNNVDCCARVCHAPSAAALKRAFGAGLATNAFDDIERARAILVCGANATESHPVVGARIRQAARRGARLVVIDPRRIELADEADVHLAVRPGSNVAALNAIAYSIVSEGLCDRDFIDRRADGFAEFVQFIGDWTPERAAAMCGVRADDIRRAARLYASNAPALSLHGLGLTEHGQGTDGVTALINLALLTGNIGKPGAGVNPLRGQNNVQGSAHMGCDPSALPGGTAIDRGREAFAAQWGVPVPQSRGLTMLEMLDAALQHRLKALWIVGYDVWPTNPNATETARALGALDLVIVQDLFLTATAREFGSIFLPACSTFEKDGTFMNAERRIQRVRAAIRPLGDSKPDWQIFCEVARAMGANGFDASGAEDIWSEVRALCEGARGMTYERLDAGGLQWPCPAVDHPGTPLLHRDGFTLGPKTVLQPIPYMPTPEVLSPGFPMLLVTGRSLYQFNAGTMTGRTPNNELRPGDTLDVSPDDAELLGIRDGEPVRIVSQYGAATLPARLTDRVQTGQLYATFQRPDLLLNAVTGPHRDGVTGTPEYKVTAVRLERTG